MGPDASRVASRRSSPVGTARHLDHTTRNSGEVWVSRLGRLTINPRCVRTARYSRRDQILAEKQRITVLCSRHGVTWDSQTGSQSRHGRTVYGLIVILGCIVGAQAAAWKGRWGYSGAQQGSARGDEALVPTKPVEEDPRRSRVFLVA